MAENMKQITKAGMEKLQAELDERISVIRNEIAKEIEFARSYGDLSENAEYTEAKNKQADNENEIARLQYAIAHSRVVDDNEINTDKVSVGNTVVIQDCKTGMKIEYAIVGTDEADPFSGKISNDSPVGRGLLGATIGQEVEIEAPIGMLKYKVLEIKR